MVPEPPGLTLIMSTSTSWDKLGTRTSILDREPGKSLISSFFVQQDAWISFFVVLACHSIIIIIIKPLSTFLSRAVNKSQQHQEKNSLECQELKPGLLGEKQVCYLCTMQPPILR